MKQKTKQKGKSSNILALIIICVVATGVVAYFLLTDESQLSDFLEKTGLPAEEREIPSSYQIENPSYYREDGFCWGASAIMLMMDYGLEEEEIGEFREVLKSGLGGPPDMFMGFSEFGVIEKVKMAYSKDNIEEFANFYNQQILVNPKNQVVLLENQEEALNKLKKLISSDVLVMIMGHYGNHYMVATGYDENYIYLNDPGIDNVFFQKVDWQDEYEEKIKMAEDNFVEQWTVSEFEGGGIGFPGDYGMIWLEK